MRATLAEKRKKIYVVITYEDSLGQTKKKWFGTGLNLNLFNLCNASERNCRLF